MILLGLIILGSVALYFGVMYRHHDDDNIIDSADLIQVLKAEKRKEKP